MSLTWVDTGVVGSVGSQRSMRRGIDGAMIPWLLSGQG